MNDPLVRHAPSVLVAAAAMLALSMGAASPALSAQQLALGLFAAPAEIQLTGSNGYAVNIEGSGSRVTLTVARGSTFASYAVRGRASTEGVIARFGHFGRVSVKFRPSGKERRKEPPKRCRGKAAVTRFGVFAGTVRFTGEDGYTRVAAHRAKGATTTSPRWKCKRRRGTGKFLALSDDPEKPPPDESGLRSAALAASTPHGRRHLDVLGFRGPKGDGFTFFLASATERRGSVRISRLAFASGRNRTFVFDEALDSATVRPPKPFHGTATFQRDPDGSTSWAGSLTVSLPGTENLALAGPRFKASLE